MVRIASVAVLLFCVSFTVVTSEDNEIATTTGKQHAGLTEEDSLAGQTSASGGRIYKEEGSDDYFLAMDGVASTFVLPDPSNPVTARLVEHHTVTQTLPRFALFISNNSLAPGDSRLPYMSLNLLELVESGYDQLVYKVEIINPDITNMTGTDVALMEDVSQSFDRGMLIIDMTNDDHKNEDGTSRSLRQQIESYTEDQQNKVRAQGAVFSWWLGPFMYACCPYGLMTLPFVALNPFSLPWVFAFCCI